jgi:hypothetical protein
MKYLKIIFLFVVIFIGEKIHAQNNVTLKYFGLTFHPFGDRTAYLQPYKLDKGAHLVANFGGFIGYEHYIWQDIASIKVMQAFFTDCSAGKAGFTHIGIRGLMLDKNKNRLMLGVGPTWFYRESWSRFPEYKDKGFFKNENGVQSKFFWYGVEIEYDRQISNNLDLSVSYTPGLPFVMTFAVGVKYWLGKDFRGSN